jgi:putative protease
MKSPELLVPAGTYEKMTYAFAYGADAVYAGVPQYSLRARENDFNEQKLIGAIDYAHSLDKKIYLTMNIFPHNRKVKGFTQMLEKVAGMKPDGLIMADPGMIMVAREKHPELEIHLSTQANTINWQTVKFWQNIGLKRIILSRELRIDEIKEIKQHVPDMELESFVHGAICIAYSGRCLLSNYFNHRDANQGTCTNACRWEYKVYEGPGEETADASYYIEESERPGNLMPIDEDEHGTYIMNAKDLSAIEILKEMREAGIDSFKVEGRTKSIYYLSVITRAYRLALDAVESGQPITKTVADEVYAVANRGYVTGFLERNPLAEGQNYEQSHSQYQTRAFLGLVKEWDNFDNMALISVRGRFEIGDVAEIVDKDKVIQFKIKKIKDGDGRDLQIAHPGGIDVKLNLPEAPGAFSILRKVLAV